MNSKLTSQQDNRDFKRTRELFGNIWKRPDGNKLFDALYNNSLEIVFMFDFNGRILDVNDRGMTLFGLEKDDVQSIYVADIIDEEDLPKAFEIIEHIKKCGFDADTRELHLRNTEGKSIWLEIACVRVDIKYKSSLILGFARDITARRQKEEAFKIYEKRYKALFDKSFELIFLYDLYGQIVEANNRALSLVGYERGELASLRLVDLLDRKDITRAVKNTMLVFEHGARPETQEYRVNTKNGGHVWIEVSGVLLEQRGESPMIMGIGRDISARKKAEETAKKAAKQSRSNGTKTAKTNNNSAANRLSGLLSAIVEGSAIVAANVGKDERLKKEADRIFQAAQQATALAEELSDGNGRE